MRTRILMSGLLALVVVACGDSGDTIINGAGGVPTISGIAPNAGPPAGGTPFTITGSGYQDGATVTVGGTPATGVVFASTVELTAVSPAGAGSVSVVVENPDGGAVALAAGFTYGPPPLLALVEPTLINTLGGTTVTLTGSGFSTGASVSVGGNPAVVQSVTPTTIVALAPAGTSGATSVVVTNDDGQLATLGTASYDAPPVITFTNAPTQVQGSQSVVFDVVATDPEGQDVSVTLLNPPVGGVMVPVPSAVSPVTGTLRWQVSSAMGGLQTLMFRAVDAAGSIALKALAIQVVGGDYGTSLLVADVTGDGVLDVVAAARFGDTTVGDAGYIGVWAGTTTIGGTPTALLQVASPTAGDLVGYIAQSSGSGLAQALHLCDVTGDGILDVVAGGFRVDTSVQDAGAVYVWAGGSGLSGTVNPTATLRVASPTAGDGLGYIGVGSGLLCCDVTGDGVLDVVVGAWQADTSVADAGAIYVWVGGSALVGTLAPTATLQPATPTAGDSLCYLAAGQGLLCCDVTGDGILDVIAGASLADTSAVDAGAIYVWAGSAGLTGVVNPTATLQLASPAASDYLCIIGGGGQGLLCCDVTGDSTLDIVVGASRADAGAIDSGAIYIWTGGSGLTGTLNPSATLQVSSPSASDRLCELLAGQGLLCCDVTGDGRVDVVAGAALADTAAGDAGAIYVWAGGSGLTGTVAPTATLQVAAPAGGDWLCHVIGGQGLLCCEVTGDGILDIVAGASRADTSVPDAGAVYVWAGGSGLSGTVNPTAILQRGSPVANDNLCHIQGSQGLLCCDVTGDSTLDIVVGGQNVDTSVGDAGAVFVWAGGSGLVATPAPTATLQLATPTAGEFLGSVVGGGGLQCCDLTGDGTLDVVVGSRNAIAGGVSAGAVFLWPGGSLSGTVNPSTMFRRANPIIGDQLGNTGGTGTHGILCCDVTGDGILDLVVGAYLANAPIGDTGPVFVFAGGAALSPMELPTALIRRPAPITGDQLGNLGNGGQGILCADVDGDGQLDVIIGAYLADAAAQDAGAVFVASGGSGLAGTVFPSTLAIDVPTTGDRLGN